MQCNAGGRPAGRKEPKLKLFPGAPGVTRTISVLITAAVAWVGRSCSLPLLPAFHKTALSQIAGAPVACSPAPPAAVNAAFAAAVRLPPPSGFGLSYRPASLIDRPHLFFLFKPPPLLFPPGQSMGVKSSSA